MFKKAILLLIVLLAVSLFADTRYYTELLSSEFYDSDTKIYKEKVFDVDNRFVNVTSFSISDDFKKIIMSIHIEKYGYGHFRIFFDNYFIQNINGTLEYTFKSNSPILDNDGSVMLSDKLVKLNVNVSGIPSRFTYKVYKLEKK